MKQNLKPVIAIAITILLGALVAWAGSYNGADVGSLPLFASGSCTSTQS